ncbi:uncharacterized protein G2W53_011553 [Senna tora]|uniref:Uncharacterized protein n=1 Tax=Senna tora TaxID=362788 RepID=A0A834X285_9FABA|nr:uncharacterized protein G2W53_011553 [Senna tora]
MVQREEPRVGGSNSVGGEQRESEAMG